MRSRSVALCLTIFLSCLGLTSAGCSVIGYEIGKSIDNGSPNRSVDRLQIPGISQGTTVQVVKNDCEVLQCTFLGTDTLPLAEYARAYSGGLRESERTDSLPSIGEKVYVDAQIANRENRYEGEFLGLDRRSMWLRQGGQTCSAQLDLRCVKRLLRENGVVVTGPHLRDLSLDASIPRERKQPQKQTAKVKITPFLHHHPKSSPFPKVQTRVIGMRLDTLPRQGK
jgi:hypothetical protein